MSRVMRGGAAVAAAIAAGMLASCGVSGGVCTAMGWTNSLVVEVQGDAADVSSLEVCDDRGCSTRDELVSEGFGPGVRNGDSWTIGLADMSTPETITVRALAADGALLSEHRTDLVWRQVGGSEQCGGPGEATVVLLL